MSSTSWLVGAGILIGIVQLAIGIALGLWMRRSGSQKLKAAEQDLLRTQEFAKTLTKLSAGVSADVERHQSQVEEINTRLDTAQGSLNDSMADVVIGVVSELMRANQGLQSQLSKAEVDLKRQSAEIESHFTRSMTDELTNLPNRRAFDDQMQKRFSEWQKHRVPYTMILIDIDHFKQVNDQHGHDVGDRVLAAVAACLRNSLRQPDFIARIGGEEFAALLPYTTLENSQRASQKILDAVYSTVTRIDEENLRCSVSLGMAAILEGENSTELMKRSDLALYAAKDGGRNRAHAHDGSNCPWVCNGPQKDTAPTDDSANESNTLSPELEVVCSDLRDHAKNIMSENQE